MKRFMSFVLVVTLASYAGASELVVNGGFETGDLTAWTIGGGDPSAAWVTGLESHSGTHSAVLSPQAGFGDVSLTQTLTTVVGQQYLASIWALGDSNQFSSTDFLDASIGSTSFVSGIPSDLQWHRYTALITATATSTDIFIHAEQDREGGALVDDISVEAVPEPATFGALGLGLIGLMRRRRA